MSRSLLMLVLMVAVAVAFPVDEVPNVAPEGAVVEGAVPEGELGVDGRSRYHHHHHGGHGYGGYGGYGGHGGYGNYGYNNYYGGSYGGYGGIGGLGLWREGQKPSDAGAVPLAGEPVPAADAAAAPAPVSFE